MLMRTNSFRIAATVARNVQGTYMDCFEKLLRSPSNAAIIEKEVITRPFR